jgi:hypothetical protein
MRNSKGGRSAAFSAICLTGAAETAGAIARAGLGHPLVVTFLTEE